MLAHRFQQKLIAVGTKVLEKQMKRWKVSLIRSCLLRRVTLGIGLSMLYTSSPELHLERTTAHLFTTLP